MAGVPLARVCWAEFDHMWFFATRSDDPDSAGRFDLARPRGTCYLALDPIAALVEKLSDPVDEQPLVSTTTLRQLVVFVGELDLEVTAADATDRAGRLPLEFGTTTPYDPTWAWADALDADERGGVIWWLRFDPAGSRGLAVFGPASSPPEDLPDPQVWPDLADRVPAMRFVDELADSFDLVDDPPSFAELHLADDENGEPSRTLGTT